MSETLDVTGLRCPLPVLRAGKALRAMTPGALLTVVATDPMAALDLPHFCHEAGHELISADEADGRLTFVIRCGARPRAQTPEAQDSGQSAA